ncbi:Wyosine [tRNA(Phe)-imidazoG37] synthetase, radical SAM superfamily [Desulfuromusa kysingii]|uniref:Wyosine [tRNA(Phe)-imidazoG37] synthetase, radical SAM superfamily n=1 Tax=Desulfuromusa kysingii TaxID=37625 RepID=A0A1H3XL10_9BACT|nr:radical SAM protein [Desulfuromusa kysingii]SDZ99294.1 Wyosine [tRNA(Phe)-imidazoG37] synthetase, radical SAM superfamily [Desulfuromusa kysingii]
MYKYLFGPVPSRRLGMSLGVDLVPKKVCSLDCVYCEVGKTTKLTLERQEYVPYAKIVAELSNYFANNPDPDYITFSGSGEPTLNSRIGDVIAFIKQTKPGIPIAVLTNGTLLYDKQVRLELKSADLVLPSLDAATVAVFNKINRPPETLTLEHHLQGLIAFRKEFSGKIWLEVLILPGYNDSEQELQELRKIIQQIKPDSVQINTLDRPGTETDLHGATKAELRRVLDLLQLDNAEIIAAAPQRKNIKSYRRDAETAILETIARRPCTLDDLVQILGMHRSEINKYLDVLDAEGKVQAVAQARGFFYKKS